MGENTRREFFLRARSYRTRFKTYTARTYFRWLIMRMSKCSQGISPRRERVDDKKNNIHFRLETYRKQRPKMYSYTIVMHMR